MKVLYLAHDLEDAAIWRRVAMLRAGGAAVYIAGFIRTEGFKPPEGIVLGRTANGHFVQRAGAVLRASVLLKRKLADAPRPEVILARNLEMLALAAQLSGRYGATLVYEVLDIHWTMLGDSPRARVMRALEGRLTRKVHLLLTSSPAFERAYFSRHKHVSAPLRVVENKVFGEALRAQQRHSEPRSPLVIGWFGILRCARSLDYLDAVTRANPGRLRVLLRGRPDRSVVPHFDPIVAANPDMVFEGAYRYPSDLPHLYGRVDLAWLIDRMDAGANSDWLLPNRLYEGCHHGAVPIALAGTETACYIQRHGIGIILPSLDVDGAGILPRLDRQRLAALQADLARLPTSTWTATAADCASLVSALRPAPARAACRAASPSTARG